MQRRIRGLDRVMHAGRKGICWLFFLLAVLLLQCRPSLQPGDPAPRFSLPGLDGRTVRLQDLEGKVVLLHFWATWCRPCLLELPELEGFFRKADPDRVALLAVCVDEISPADLRGFLDTWGLRLPVYLDPGGKLARTCGTFRYPETYVLDSGGLVKRKIVGNGNWNSAAGARFLLD